MDDETKVRRASCSCGRLSVTVTGAPVRVSMCHCLECQKRTGSLFGAQARWPRESVVLAGEPTVWRRIGDDGGAMDFHFCPVCGSTVWYIAVDQPDIIAVATGGFADPDFPMPDYSVYEDRKHGWLNLPGDMQHDS
jgi:hypothetical protein